MVPLLVSLSCQWSTGHRGLTLAWAWPYRSGLGLAPVARGFAEQNGLICVHHHGHLSAHGPGASRWPALLLPGDPPEYPRGNNTRIAFASAQLLIPRLRCKPILGALQALGSQDTTWPPKPPAFLDVVARFWRSPPQQKTWPPAVHSVEDALTSADGKTPMPLLPLAALQRQVRIHLVPPRTICLADAAFSLSVFLPHDLDECHTRDFRKLRALSQMVNVNHQRFA